MPSHTGNLEAMDPKIRDFYCGSLLALKEEGIPFLVGGAYALAYYTGVERHTKDLDIFIRAEDFEALAQTISRSGYKVEMVAPHWLGKAWCDDDFIDIIFNSGNGITPVDDLWFDHAVNGQILDVPILVCPPEEMIWTKAFVMERERYDGADIAHMLLACGASMDWEHLLERFGSRWPVLLSHLVLFTFIYPDSQSLIPEWVLEKLTTRLQIDRGLSPSLNSLCQGTLLSRTQYCVDIEKWGYQDARPEESATSA